MTGNWSGSGAAYNSTAGPIKVNVTETTSGAATVSSTPTGTTNTNTAFLAMLQQQGMLLLKLFSVGTL